MVRGGVYLEGVCLGGQPMGGHLPRGVSAQGMSVLGVSAQRGRGVCLWGASAQEVSARYPPPSP